MSLPGKRREGSTANKIKRSKSSENKKKMSFVKEESNQLSINTILQNTVKSTNQTVLGSQPHYRESVLCLNREPIGSEKVSGNQNSQNEQNAQMKDVYSWEIFKIEEKRKIKGIKAKILWCNGKDNNWILIRVVLTDNYTRMNQPEYFIELDSSNLQITLQQQKLIQKSINYFVQQQQNKGEQMRTQIFVWLKSSLIQIHSLFVSMKFNLRKKVKVTEYKRSKLNKNYVLYPSPASLTWSPHGMLCLTQNKVGSVSIPIVGNVHSYRNLIEAPYRFERFSRKNNQIDDLKMVEERKQDEQETTEAEFFGWNVKQQINFSIFGKLIEQDIIESKPTKSQTNENTNEKPEKKASKDYETYYLGNTNNMTTKVQKIYRRYFCGSCENAQFQFLEKLKVFVIKCQSSELEDGISYLIDKIQRHDRSGAVDALLQNQFTGFNAAFNKIDKKEQKFEKLKYQLISQFLQQKIKHTPQSQHFLYMKCIMIENQFFRLALQSYFEDNLKKIKILDKKYQQLGTFDNFDDFKAQKILFFLLQEILKTEKSLKDDAERIKYYYRIKPQKYDDLQYKQKKYAKIVENNVQMKLLLKGYVKKVAKNGQFSDSSSPIKLGKSQSTIHLQYPKQHKQRNVNLNLMPFLVVNKIQLSSFQFNLILNPNQRKNFLETVIPILWIKDRSSENFQYKLAKRVLITNAKIINFLDKLNSIINLWKKMEGGRRSNFLKTILKQYNRFQKKSGYRGGKMYTAYCQRCTGDFVAFNIEQLLRVTRCSRCKYLEGNDLMK